MAKKITNVDQLLSAVQNEITKNLKAEHNQKFVKQIMRNKIVKDVYAVYPNPSFPRRGRHGGLTDFENMEIQVKRKGNKNINVKITNNTKPKGFDEIGRTSEYLDKIIEEGTGGSAVWQQPRPFMQSTEDRLREGRIFEKIIINKHK